MGNLSNSSIRLPIVLALCYSPNVQAHSGGTREGLNEFLEM